MKLKLFEDNRGRRAEGEIEIDPSAVSSLSETIRYRQGQALRVAYIELRDGQRFTVLDPERKLYPAVREANQSALLVRQA